MINKTVVLYPGRFQPMGKHHAATFLWVQNKFGKNNTFIGTSDITDSTDNPFNFEEKKAIIDMYGLGKYVKKVKNPYKAEEILKKYDLNTTAFIVVVGQKDADRLSTTGYFRKYTDKTKLKPASEQGYIVIAPHISLKVPGKGEMSGTSIRKALGDPKKTPQEKKELFNQIFGWYSTKLSNYIIKKLTKNPVKEDMIPGGLASGKSLEDISTKHKVAIDQLNSQLDKGIRVELEHTSDKDIAREIAMDHLMEDPIYYDKLASVEKNESKLFTTTWWTNILTESRELNEGGAGGHILYTFELPKVKTGKDLIDIHNKAIISLQKTPASVKIDGINIAMKVVDVKGKKQFALDRGSTRDADIKGVTKSDLSSRFPEGHGMIGIAGKVIDAFNASIPVSKPYLVKLGLWDNPEILLNIEYVSSNINVTKFKENFISIHGLMQISTDKDGKRHSKEISYSKEDLSKFAEVINPIFQKEPYKLSVYYDVKTKVVKPIKLSSLEKPVTIKLVEGKEITKKLKDWLSKTTIPSMSEPISWSGKRVPAMKRQVFVDVLNGAPITDNTKTKEDAQKVINAFITWKAALDMGEDILQGLDSSLGKGNEQEGIIIRDPKLYAGPFKIIGNFIIRAMSSPFKSKPLKEGGNVFKKDGVPTTRRIKKEEIKDTVEWLEQLTTLPLRGNLLGSTGIKPDSSDIDIGIDEKKISKDKLVAILKKWADSKNLDSREWITKTGDSVHFKAPINGDDNKGYVQVDFMFGDPIWMQYALKGAPADSKFKAVHRHVLIASIAKFNGLKWSTKDGLVSRTSGKIITKNPDEIADKLLGAGKKAKDLESVESILNSIKDNPKYEEMVREAKDTLNKIYKVDI